jgi:hypothetical protein
LNALFGRGCGSVGFRAGDGIIQPKYGQSEHRGHRKTQGKIAFWEAIMRGVLLVLGTVLFSVTLALSQAPSSKPISAFDQQLIDRQKQFLQATQSKNPTAVDCAIADDFRGIGTNGDFYAKSEVVESAQEGMPKDTRAYDFLVVKLNDASAVVAYNLIVPGEHPRYRHMADTWAKIDGRWKLKFRQITPNLWSANDLD